MALRVQTKTTTSPTLAFVIGVERIRQVRLRKAWKSHAGLSYELHTIRSSSEVDIESPYSMSRTKQ